MAKLQDIEISDTVATIIADKNLDLMEAGLLRSYSSWGSYPVFYIEGKDTCLCPSCATERLVEWYQDGDITQPINLSAHVNWGDLYCYECSITID